MSTSDIFRNTIGNLRDLFLFQKPRLYLIDIAAILQLTAWMTGFNRVVPYAAAVCVGALVVMSGMAIRACVTIYMERRKDWGLLTNGPFAVCRHPRYVGSITAMGGLILATGYAPYGLWLVPLLLAIVPHTITARAESRHLSRRYCKAYYRYRTAPPRIRGPEQGLHPLTWSFARRQLAFPTFLMVVAGGLAFQHCDQLVFAVAVIAVAIHA